MGGRVWAVFKISVMQHLNGVDIAWLDVIQIFALSEADVILARYVLACQEHKRVFSEHYLVSTTGWSEYVIRRILGHWQSMGMASAKLPPAKSVVVSSLRFGSGLSSISRVISSRRKHTGLQIELSIKNIPLNKNRIERCAQLWEVDTYAFYYSLHERILWVQSQLRSKSATNTLVCGCHISDSTQYLPGGDGIICQVCNQQVEEYQHSSCDLANTPLYEVYTRTFDSRFTPYILPPIPDSLRLRRVQEVSGLCDELEYESDSVLNDNIWRDEEGDEEDFEEQAVSIQGHFKLWSQVTDEDLQHMTDAEHKAYVALCEWE